jgi:hypothetical protein
MPRSLLFACGLCLVVSWTARADSATETRLRDTLKQVVQQLRAAQDQIAAAQAAQAESDRQLGLAKDQITQLSTDFKNLKDKSEADHEAAVKAIAQLNEQNALLQRVVEDRERKNYELYKTGNEVLTRYEKFSLGEAIEAKEPFMGLTRVKLENLVQGYEDKFASNKTYAGQPVTEVKNDPANKSAPVDHKPDLPAKSDSADNKPVAADPAAAPPAPDPGAPVPPAASTSKDQKDSGDKDKVMRSPR